MVTAISEIRLVLTIQTQLPSSTLLARTCGSETLDPQVSSSVCRIVYSEVLKEERESADEDPYWGLEMIQKRYIDSHLHPSFLNP